SHGVSANGVVIKQGLMAVREQAISIPKHHAIGDGVQPAGRAKLRHAIARRGAKLGKRCCWYAGLERKRRVRGRHEIHMVGPHFVNKRVTLWPRDEVVWMASRWRNDAI